ncbi:aspartyl protease family protein [Psychroserpens sp. NJDZ02]|uniref:aspartyl protease family protein n=1 Tax=Psychroserpens sp. NJDZ02 TaxID=2570561 RepID=UPI0010A80D4E|nr:aspartyl protease family protein [Psychroserpens sp. NJDZ02]QCE40408.1 PDZ domain-containing protein [Psychroserpens sp. NJDZ02]
MNYNKFILLLLLLFSIATFSQSQYRLKTGVKSEKVRFELVNNIIIIPVKVNGIDLKFLLDTGVNKPIVFNFYKALDSLRILNSKKIKLKGLGEGGFVNAVRSSHNIFEIGNAVNMDQAFYTIFDSNLNFAPKLGVPIDGIIGYDLFKDFVIEIDYVNKYIRLFNPLHYKYRKCKKCDIINLDIIGNKPYVEAKVGMDSLAVPVKLLIDSGSSDALWMFENKSKGLFINDNYFKDFLGAGLSGDVYGKRTKVKDFSIGKFSFNNPKVAYPDSIIVKNLKKNKDRDGSLGGEILKRFNCVFDYPNSRILLRTNNLYKLPFSYNRSGLQVENDGVRLVMELSTEEGGGAFIVNKNNKSINFQTIVKSNYKYHSKPSFSISVLREGSPADLAGLNVGDVITYVNGKSTHNMSLNQLVGYFYKKPGTRLELKVFRFGKERIFSFELKSPIK